MSYLTAGGGGSQFGFDMSLMQDRQKQIAQAQADFDKPGAVEEKAQEGGAIGGSTGALLSGIQKTKDLVKKVRQGPDLLKTAVSNIEEKVGQIQRVGVQATNIPERVAGRIPVPQARPGPVVKASDLPDLPGLASLPAQRPTPGQVVIQGDADGTRDVGGAIRGQVNRVAQDVQGRAQNILPDISRVGQDLDNTDDFQRVNRLGTIIQRGAQNLHQQVQDGANMVGRQARNVAQRVGDATSGLSDGLEGGLGIAEGVVDTLGPIGDLVGLGMGIFGGIEAHKEAEEKEASAKQQQQAVDNLPNANVTHTGVVNVGNTAQPQMGQSAMSHY